MTPLFVAVADLHFDEHGSWKHRGVHGDSAFALGQAVDLAHRFAAPLVLLGDIVNRPMPRQAGVRELLAEFDRCRELGVPVHYVLGDHDGRQDWSGLHPWPRHADRTVVEFGPFPFYGLDYLPRGPLQEALAEVPAGVCGLLTHQKWEDFVGGSGQGKFVEVPARVRFVLTGDYHTFVDGEFAGHQVWSPGSAIAVKVDEAGPRYIMVGFADDDAALAVEAVPLVSRPVHRVRVADADAAARLATTGIEEILAVAEQLKAPEYIRRPIVDVEYFTDVPGVRDQLKGLADRCFLFLRPRDRERQRRRAEEAVASSGRGRIDVVDAVRRLAPAGTPGRDWTLRLMAAHDMPSEWRAIVKEIEEEAEA